MRGAFQKLFIKAHKDVSESVEFYPSGGYKEAVGKFRESLGDTFSFVLIDLDAEDDPEGENRRKKVSESGVELEPAVIYERVFFMVQEMEAWFLSQPEAVWDYYNNKFFSSVEKCKFDLETLKQNECFQKKTVRHFQAI